MRIVLKIGGSVIASPINPDLINKYVNLLKILETQNYKLVVVVGGGTLARELITVARNLELNEQAQDEIAISASRIFAQFFIKKLGEIACKIVPSTIEVAIRFLNMGKIVVMGGLKPGMTTDTVAAIISEKAKADLLIKATDQNGVYDKDPGKHVDAVKIDHLSFKGLLNVFGENKHKAGIHRIIDPEAIKILKRGRVKTFILNGFQPENVLEAIKGKHIGTVIE